MNRLKNKKPGITGLFMIKIFFIQLLFLKHKLLKT